MSKPISAIPLFLMLALTACFKQEDPIVLPQGNSQISTCFIGTDYENNVYFDLGTNTYQIHPSDDWDIRFESDDTAWGMFINTGNNIKLYKTDLYALNDPRSDDTNYIKSFKPLIDAPEGNPFTSASANWRLFKRRGIADSLGVYVIDLSYESGSSQYKKVQILNVTHAAYRFVIADLYSTQSDTIILLKDKSSNYSYFSFRNGGQIVQSVEPNQAHWDFMFTRYNHNFMGILPNNEPFPYRVAGVLCNRNGVLVARDSITGFDAINAGMIRQLQFSDRANAIGYDWKSHAFAAAGNYVVNQKITYIIKDTDGQFFKLRFLDFYNAKAEKGYPKFEFIRIQ